MYICTHEIVFVHHGYKFTTNISDTFLLTVSVYSAFAFMLLSQFPYANIRRRQVLELRGPFSGGESERGIPFC